MDKSLEKLLDENTKKNLWYGELAAWVHNINKFTDNHIIHHSRDKQLEIFKDINLKNDSSTNKDEESKIDYIAHFSEIFNLPIEITSNKIIRINSIHELIKNSKTKTIEDCEINLFIRILARCHNAAHIEKEEEEDKEIKIIKERISQNIKKSKNINSQLNKVKEDSSLKSDKEQLSKEKKQLERNKSIILSIKKPYKDNTWISTPFGYEYENVLKLNDKIKNLKFKNIDDRKIIIESIRENFSHALGDNRFPINEITLEDWSEIVAALYKAALAYIVLKGNDIDPKELKWRFLYVRVNAAEVWGDSSNIPILLARKNWMKEQFDELKELLEEEYHLGNEIYRDENGSIFVVPNIKNLLEFKTEDDINLKQKIINTMSFDGEIVVNPKIQLEDWSAQCVEYKEKPENNQIPQISKILEDKLPSVSPDYTRVNYWWKNKKKQICVASHIRPIGLNDEDILSNEDCKRILFAQKRNLSLFWYDKINCRVINWLKQIGFKPYFNIHQQQECPNEDRGSKLKSTIWIDEVADSNGRICLLVGKLEIQKWLEQDGFINTLLISSPSEEVPTPTKKTPSFSRTFRIWETTAKFWKEVNSELILDELKKETRIIFEVKYSEKNDFKRQNAYRAIVDGISFSILYIDNNKFIIIENLELIYTKIKPWINNNDIYQAIIDYIEEKNIKIIEADGQEYYKNKNENNDSVHKIIKVQKYQNDYAPVVPILTEPSVFMAIIPADTALDIVKNIKEKYEKEMGKVRSRLPLKLGMIFAKSHVPISSLMYAGWNIINRKVETEKWNVNTVKKYEKNNIGTQIISFNNETKWEIQIQMNKTKVNDNWYPYFCVEGDMNDRIKKFTHMSKNFVHVSEIKENDELFLLPSTFDFEFLDSSNRRFDVVYDKDCKRYKNKLKPYYLEELDDFINIWLNLSTNLYTTQIKKLIYLIESKREEWNITSDYTVFNQYVRNVLKNAKWKNKPDNKQFDIICEAAISGKLRDIIEFYLGILKV